MKKTLKILVLTLLVSFGFLTGLKAESKTLDCKYRRNYMGDPNSKYNFDFTITFIANTDNTSVGHRLSDNSFTAGDKTFTVRIQEGFIDGDDAVGTAVGPYISWNNKTFSEQILKGECLPLYFSEDQEKKVVDIFPYSAVSNRNILSLTNVDSSNNDVNVNLNSNEKVCQLSIDKVTLQKKTGKSLNADDYSNNRVYTFNVITRNDDTVFIKFFDGKEYGVKSLITRSGVSNYAWENSVSLGFLNSKKISLKDDAVDSFKNAFKYDNVTCPSIFLNLNGSRFDISLTKSDNSIEVSPDFKVEESETLKQLAKDLGFFKNITVSDEVSGCLAYVGEDLAEMLQTIYTIIKIVSIILTIVLSMVDFLSVLTKDKDELMNTVKKWVRRLIIVIVILLLPTFIDIIGNIAGKEDILCGIR